MFLWVQESFSFENREIMMNRKQHRLETTPFCFLVADEVQNEEKEFNTIALCWHLFGQIYTNTIWVFSITCAKTTVPKE